MKRDNINLLLSFMRSNILILIKIMKINNEITSMMLHNIKIKPIIIIKLIKIINYQYYMYMEMKYVCF